jgi:uncharacterized Zn-binding protein involved in type VI secretion
MARPAARTTDRLTPHSPCAPGQCGIGSENVIIENKLAYRVGDSTFPHGYILCAPHTSRLSVGSSKVMINNRPAGRVGDAHTCGVRVATGASKVLIG